MGDEAAEAALSFLTEHAGQAGAARAQMTYMEHWRKSVLARLKRESTEKTAEGREAWARAHPDYEQVLLAQYAAVEEYERLHWKRIAAEATLDAWRTKNANQRGAGRMQ